ncbi:MAG: SDR family NAD(P)-dependent oxidoreductase [Candidatus Limnocylindrales bacterium]
MAPDERVLAGRTAVVTGGSRGIGRATSLRLAGLGAEVVIDYRRDEEAAAATVADIEAIGGRGYAVRADLEDPEAIDALFAEVGRRSGRLHALVLNAAATANRPLLEVGTHHMTRTFQLSVFGMIRCIQAATPLMDQGGSIVAVSGIDVVRNVDGHGLLAAAKGAMEVLTRYFAVELAPRSINVNAVRPGSVDTESFRLYAGDRYEEFRAEKAAQTVRGRVGRPEDIAETIAFLCTPAADWICGQVVTVDGGRELR